MVFAVVSSTINVFFTWLRESARTFFRACHQKCGWARICENCENIYLFMTLSSTIHVLNIRARICENVGESARICENCFIGPGPWGPCSGPWKPPGPLSRTLESSIDLLMHHMTPSIMHTAIFRFQKRLNSLHRGSRCHKVGVFTALLSEPFYYCSFSWDPFGHYSSPPS